MFAMEYKKIGIRVLASRRLKGFTQKSYPNYQEYLVREYPI